MITNIIQYNDNNSITKDAQLMFFITFKETQTWGFNNEVFTDLRIDSKCIQFEYTTP